MPTEEICNLFNELRSDIVLLYDLKLALASSEFELQTLRHQYEALVPGKVSSNIHTKISLYLPNSFSSSGFDVLYQNVLFTRNLKSLMPHPKLNPSQTIK